MWRPAPLSQTTYEDYDWQVAVNFTGPFNGVQAFLPHLLAHGEGGQIVSTSSMLGLVTFPNWAIYSAAKAAIVMLSEALRAELSESNIGVSVYCPGQVNNTRTRPKGNPEAMDPFEAGKRVLRGIRRNDLYILTHPEWRQGVVDRHEALLASFPTAAKDSNAEAVTSPTYSLERDHRRCTG